MLLYEGADASRLRRVCVKVLDRAAGNDAVRCARFHDEAHGANVIDIGTTEGLPYFVTTECELAPPPPRPKKPPPPLPKKPSSKPPPLPKKPKPSPEIPIFVDEDAILVSTPAPPIPIPSDPVPPMTFEPEPRARARASWWFLLVAMTAITGFAGWFVGRAQSDVAPASASDPNADRPPPATTTAEPPAPPPAIESTTPAAESAPLPTPSSKPRTRPTVDPLTI